MFTSVLNKTLKKLPPLLKVLLHKCLNGAIAPFAKGGDTIFWTFIILHITFWTLAPLWVRFNLPMDSIEGTIWSQKLVFGYDKAPLLNAWITALAIGLFGYVDWAIYLTSQLSVAICFITLWQLAKKILQPVYALVAIVILEGFQYYNIGAIDFDDNVLQLPLWALCCLFFYQALTEKKLQQWGWLGFFAGLAMLAKYYAILLLISMLAFLCRRENRHVFSEKGIYLALAIFLGVITPHIIWLFQNDFLTVHYVFRRVGDLPTWTSHLINPLLFLRDEAYALIVPGLLLAVLFSPPLKKSRAVQRYPVRPSLRGLRFLQAEAIQKESKHFYWIAARILRSQRRAIGCYHYLLSLMQAQDGRPRKTHTGENVSNHSFDQTFLIYLAIGPFLLALLISILTGIKLHIMWGSALFSLWGILFISFLQPTLNPKKLYQFFIVMLLLFFMALSGYLLSIHWAKNNSSAHFPGRTMAHSLMESWNQRYHQPLAYVIGNRWLAGNLSFYSAFHPTVFIDGDLKLVPWLNLLDLSRKGALLIWDANKFGNTIPAEYKRFMMTQHSSAEIKTFNWQEASGEAPVKIGILFLPPGNYLPDTED